MQATLTPGAFNGFGFVRVFDISDPANPVKLSEVKLPSTNDPNAPPFGSHNVMVRGNTAYVAWYTDGLVVVDISNPTAPQVIAQAVDPTDNYWGVFVQGELIFTSDRAGGLKIYKHVP